MFFSHEKEGNLAICENTGGHLLMLSKIRQRKTNTTWYNLHVQPTKKNQTHIN